MSYLHVLFIESAFAILEFHNTGDVRAQLETQFSDRIVQLLIQL